MSKAVENDFHLDSLDREQDFTVSGDFVVSFMYDVNDVSNDFSQENCRFSVIIWLLRKLCKCSVRSMIIDTIRSSISMNLITT